MPTPLMLTGEVDNRDELILSLQEQNRQLSSELATARAELAAARRENARAINSLRQQLSPLYRALQQVFGEMEQFTELGESGNAPPDRVRAVWDSWKAKLGGGKPGELIDALLQHGEMNAVQLRVALHCHINTVYETTAKLQKLGLLNKNGGKYSLKSL